MRDAYLALPVDCYVVCDLDTSSHGCQRALVGAGNPYGRVTQGA